MDKQTVKKLRELVKQGKDKEVLTSLDSILLINPRDVFALLNLSIFMIGQGKMTEAMELEKKALKIDRDCIAQFKENSIFPESGYNLTSEGQAWLLEALKDLE
ncbi:MAG TPA: hypothetical protein PLM07_06220 [Candidatus Rifleibacterium sp.]|nr:hypothetical protein [Candidatus Rifleibacterium sp.]HPT45476.1 hypothetical protein [Candidatus Rifleibacterium sp.]